MEMNPEAPTKGITLIGESKRLRFNTQNGFILINPQDLVYIRAQGSYSELVLKDNLICLVTVRIGKIIDLLPGGFFFRNGRSYLVNYQYIFEVNRKKEMMSLKHGCHTWNIPITRDKAAELSELL